MAVRRSVASVLAAGIASALLLAAAPASAQSFLEQIFGGLRQVFSPPAASVYPDGMRSMASAPDGRVVTADSGPSRAFCVRTCDGHYFPVEAHGRLTAATACQSACPAAETKLYSGSNIDYALGRDGSRYADLPNAFLYRKKLVTGCTCNGRTAFGLAPVATAQDDPSLKPGDVVATQNGLMAVNGSGQFTPASSYAGFGSSDRAQFSQMKVTPVDGVPRNAVAAQRPSFDERSTALNTR
jgi:Protein of unknown function (DUF2865)